MKTAILLLALGMVQQGPARIVFLGDSITDGNTAPLLLCQALGEKAPVCINAGVAGDTAAGMRKRLERDVMPRRPALVTLSVGINDIFHKVSAADYEADVTAISERLKLEGIPMLLLTPTILGAKHAETEKRLAEYIGILRRLAAKEGYAVAEVHALMQEGRASGRDLLEPDQVHLTFDGYRVMIRALLDALGHRETAVPAELAVEPMVGILRDWKIRALPEGEWKTLTLPQSGKAAHWWVDQERRRGFAVELDKLAGPAKRFAAAATLESKEARDVFFNTGADLASLTLNGKLLWKSEGWTGWHAGKERIAARLAVGANRIEIESGAAFFLSVTDENTW
jgi:lysophospholipase L1-like esterase